VQVGAFGSAASADRIVRELGAAGFEARVVRVARGGHALHRVRVGHASDKAAAEQLARQLQARGLPGTVVADD
jgi:cell division septation protein DedD